jgi:2-haloacid dehalogenase
MKVESNMLQFCPIWAKGEMNTDLVIIFDFGGVLLDWNPRYLYRKLFDGDEMAMERFLSEVDFYSWNECQDGGRPFDEGLAVACAEHPNYCQLLHLYRERWSESIAGPIEGSLRILESCRTAGRRIVGLSNWSAETFPLMRDTYEFFKWFEFILLSGEVGVNKPEKRIFELLLERLGCPAAECVLIDDSSKNIAAARALNFKTIQFTSPEQLRKELMDIGVQL